MRVPLPPNEPERVAAVRAYEILDTPPEDCYDELIELAVRVCGTPAGYIKFFDETRVSFKSKVGLPPDLVEMPREETLCNWTLYRPDLVVIPDCSLDERFRHHDRVTSWPEVRFYCSMPLIDAQGFALGTFCVFDFVPHEMTFDQQEAVRTLAHQAVSQLELRRTSTSLRRSLFELEAAKRAVEQEQAKADDLLRNILPPQVADELKATGKVEPRYHQLVSILFSDFCGFTRFSESLEPGRLVQSLDRYFSAFDEIVERHGLEKIKTIGDSYMCAGGLPGSSRSHVVETCLAGVEMLETVTGINTERKKEGLDAWEMRVGIHAGPVMSGVVGRRKFTYDIWGDVVNIAQRLQVAGAPGRINVSEAVFNRVNQLFDIEPRGAIAIDGKGPVPMYFVDRIRSDLSSDSEGRAANGQFEHERIRI